MNIGKLDNPYTTECLDCGINLWSQYLYYLGMDNDTAQCANCLIANPTKYEREIDIMSEQLPTFGEWCDLHSFNPDNDDNFNLYLVWVERERRN